MTRFSLIFLIAVALCGCTKKSGEVEPLRVSAIPDESPTELMRKFGPLGRHLEARIGRPVKFIPVTDYAATVEGLAAKKLDMVWYGGFTFVQAKRRTGSSTRRFPPAAPSPLARAARSGYTETLRFRRTS